MIALRTSDNHNACQPLHVYLHVEQPTINVQHEVPCGGAVKSIAWSPCDDRLAVETDDHYVTIVDVATGDLDERAPKV